MQILHLVSSVNPIVLIVGLTISFIILGYLIDGIKSVFGFNTNNIYQWPGDKQPGPEFYGIYYPSQEMGVVADDIKDAIATGPRV